MADDKKVGLGQNILTNEQILKYLNKHFTIQNVQSGKIYYIKQKGNINLLLYGVQINLHGKQLTRYFDKISKITIQRSIISNGSILNTDIQLSSGQLINMKITDTDQIITKGISIYQNTQFNRVQYLEFSKTQVSFFKCNFNSKLGMVQFIDKHNNSVIQFDDCQFTIKDIRLQTSKEYTIFNQSYLNTQKLQGVLQDLAKFKIQEEEQLITTGGQCYDSKYAFSSKTIDKKKLQKIVSPYIVLQQKQTKKTQTKKKQLTPNQKLQAKIKKIVKSEVAQLFYLLYRKRNLWSK